MGGKVQTKMRKLNVYNKTKSLQNKFQFKQIKKKNVRLKPQELKVIQFISVNEDERVLIRWINVNIVTFINS